MKVTFLKAAVPLTKTFSLEGTELKKTAHPQVIQCSSFQHDITTIEELYSCFEIHAAEGHCFLKGNVTRQLIEESRAGTTDPNAPTEILLLDLDGLRDVADVDTFMGLLGLGDVDYIVQYSSSMGVIPSRGISAHIFCFLDKPWSPALLKQWLTNANLTNPALKRNLGLTRTNNSLRWALDVSTCQNDKLIYIAPPIVGVGVVDTFSGDRIQLVKRAKRTVTLPEPIPSAEANRSKVEQALNELRTAAGLPTRDRIKFKTQHGVEYMRNPDQAVVTGIKKERGFVYLNLNGGDSWAYYHTENNPVFIHNFKSEPAYLTSELVPDYWMDVKGTVGTPKFTEDGTLYLAFRDFRTAGYWNGTYEKQSRRLNLAQAKSADQLRSFLKQHGQPLGDFIPDWNVTFNPSSPQIVDIDTRAVNLYQPSEFMKLEPRKIDEVPKTIRKVILHALGGDDEVFEHFMNWLAVILQYKCRTMTSWVLHGTQGTGKGIMLNYILRPIFGMDYVVSKRMEELESQFNGYMERCFILFVDEAQLSSHGRKDVMDANFKNYIVEPRISIRRMHTMPYEVDNYLNLIFASNKLDPVIIDPEDRRFNVGVYQSLRLYLADEELDRISEELEEFYHYLASRDADRAKARHALNNPAKQKMVHISRESMDVICEAFNKGDFQFLWDQRPVLHLKDGTGNTSQDIMNGKYLALLTKIAQGERPSLLREELQTMLGYLHGSIPASPHKFTSYIKHHGIVLEPTNRDGRTVRGLKVEWNITPELMAEVIGKKENASEQEVK
jgi:hypothetical protein